MSVIFTYFVGLYIVKYGRRTLCDALVLRLPAGAFVYMCTSNHVAEMTLNPVSDGGCSSCGSCGGRRQENADCAIE